MNEKRPTNEVFAHHEDVHYRYENPLRDVILGGQDGLVNALGIILGVSAAGGDVKILIATGLAAACAESISMGAVAYTSALSQKDYYESERRKEEKEVEEKPEMERNEIRRVYATKGFTGKVLDEIVTTITSNKKLWVDTIMKEELRLSRINTQTLLKSSVIVTVATGIGHLIPLSSFFFFSHETGLVSSIIASVITLFTVGAYQARNLVGSWWKSGIRLVLIGLSAAFIGFFIAKLFGAIL